MWRAYTDDILGWDLESDDVMPPQDCDGAVLSMSAAGPRPASSAAMANVGAFDIAPAERSAPFTHDERRRHPHERSVQPRCRRRAGAVPARSSPCVSPVAGDRRAARPQQAADLT